MSQEIEVRARKAASIICTITGIEDITLYNATMVVKASLEADEELIKKELTEITSSPFTFVLKPTDTDLDAGTYFYEVELAHKTDTDLVFSPIQSILKIKPSLT